MFGRGMSRIGGVVKGVAQKAGIQMPQKAGTMANTPQTPPAKTSMREAAKGKGWGSVVRK